MTVEIDRPPFDEHGGRIAACMRCGMAWCEYREPIELMRDIWTGSGELEHECPEPFSPEVARSMLAAVSGSGTPITQRMKAQIKLGLEAS